MGIYRNRKYDVLNRIFNFVYLDVQDTLKSIIGCLECRYSGYHGNQTFAGLQLNIYNSLCEHTVLCVLFLMTILSSCV